MERKTKKGRGERGVASSFENFVVFYLNVYSDFRAAAIDLVPSSRRFFLVEFQPSVIEAGFWEEGESDKRESGRAVREARVGLV